MPDLLLQAILVSPIPLDKDRALSLSKRVTLGLSDPDETMKP